MKTKISVSITIILLLLIYVPSVTYAQTATSAGTTAQARKDAMQEKRTDLETQKIESLKARANQEIDRRIASLTNLITRINNLKRLSTDQKSALTTQIQTEINTLTNLKAKIAADTTLDTLKTDVQSIVKSFRVYALFMPQIHILAGSDSLIYAADQATELSTKLQTRIQEAQAQGKDVTTLLTLLTNMTTKISDAKKQASDAANIVVTLTPDGYPENKTSLENARSMLLEGKKDLVAVRVDAKTIAGKLREFKLPTTPSASSAAR